MDRRRYKKILIIKPSSLGDIVLSLPVLSVLRREYPEAILGWVVKQEWGELLKGHPYIDRLFSFPFSPSGFLQLVREVRRERWDIVIDLQGLFRSGLLAYLSGTEVRVGFAHSPYAREFSPLFYTKTVPVPARLHRVERYLLCAAVLGTPIGPPEFLIPGQMEEKRMAEIMGKLSSPVVVLHPFTRGPERKWSFERWRSCGERLIGEGSSVIWIGTGEGDRFLAKGPRCINLIGQTTLKELVSILRKADLLVTADSGPMHIAAALGTPVVALFGPTDPVDAGPYGTGHYLIHKKVLSDISVEEVVDGVFAILAKKYTNLEERLRRLEAAR